MSRADVYWSVDRSLKNQGHPGLRRLNEEIREAHDAREREKRERAAVLAAPKGMFTGAEKSVALGPEWHTPGWRPSQDRINAALEASSSLDEAKAHGAKHA